MTPRSGALVVALLVAFAAACRSSETLWSPRWNAEYGQLGDLRDEFTAIRALIESERFDEAWLQLTPLVAADEENLELATQLQEVEWELLTRGTDVDPGLSALADEGDVDAALRRRYASRAETSGTVAQLVLAARAESDALAALNLLDRALVLDPHCAWAHYGRAHALLDLRSKSRRWSAAQDALDAALDADPSHLRARRLQAWMLAQEGALAQGAKALQVWLEQTRDDPRFSRRERREAELDLALLFILDGAGNKARHLLTALEGEPVGRGRRLALLAVAEHLMGDFVAALDAARRAEGALDDELLPIVQQAILYEYWLEDVEAADRQWEDVIERAVGQGDMAQVLQSFRARVILERRAAARDRVQGAR
ncbi:MAG: tetratricopeptide (TPR) repeat protein [Chlamydiales bacterium]|jgi:tetratricopeptide (TPR) repeat protein